jgi:hypothetical protein
VHLRLTFFTRGHVHDSANPNVWRMYHARPNILNELEVTEVELNAGPRNDGDFFSCLPHRIVCKRARCHALASLLRGSPKANGSAGVAERRIKPTKANVVSKNLKPKTYVYDKTETKTIPPDRTMCVRCAVGSIPLQRIRSDTLRIRWKSGGGSQWGHDDPTGTCRGYC